MATVQDLRLPPKRYLAVAAICFVLTVVWITSSTAERPISSLPARLGLWDDKGSQWTSYAGLNTSHDSAGSRSGSSNSSARASAAFVVMVGNNDLWGLLESIRGMEDRFNHKHHYDYVFLHNEPFSEEFKRYTSRIASGRALYGLISPSDWNVPDWIDEERAATGRAALTAKKVIHGDSVPFRQMMRFQSGFFWRHELLAPYDYYWRIEPNVKYVCDVDYDPFIRMRDEGKKFGFAISLFEYSDTIATLWNSTKEFIDAHPEHISQDNLMSFISDDGASYNRCHFWSNFEIGDLNFFRSEAYRSYFEWLDQAGGFFYERWGDAPVHTVAASLLLSKDQVHFFSDFGYKQGSFEQCPQDRASQCACNPQTSFDKHWYSCAAKYRKAGGLES